MSKPKRKPRLAFNPAKEAESLYFMLLKRGEYTAAASILNRLLGSTDSSPEKQRLDDAAFDVNALTDPEFEELGRLLELLNQFKARVRQRLGLDAPTSTAPVAQPRIDRMTQSVVDAIVEEPHFELSEDEIEIDPDEEEQP